jgi:hypothetical protein
MFLKHFLHCGTPKFVSGFPILHTKHNVKLCVCVFVCVCARAYVYEKIHCCHINPLTPELHPSVQRCLTRFFTGEFVSWTVHFVNICAKIQQIQQLFIQFINYVWYLLPVSALHCHLRGEFLVPSERCSIEEQSIEYCGWACCVYWLGAWRSQIATHRHAPRR